MRFQRAFLFVFSAGLCSGAWAFDLTTSYGNGLTTYAASAGGSVQLNLDPATSSYVTKVDWTDPILTTFAGSLTGTSHEGATVVDGGEFTGTWDVDQLQAAAYTDFVNQHKDFGYGFNTQMTSTDPDLANLRVVWMIAGWSQGAAGAQAIPSENPPLSDPPFFYNPTDEQNAQWNDGTNYFYGAGAGLGDQFSLSDVGTYTADGWLLVFNDTTDPASGAETIAYRGGIHWDETITTTPVPEPFSLIGLGGGVLGLALARRRRRI